MKSRKNSIITLVSSLFLLACTNNEPVTPGGGNNHKTAAVKVHTVSFEGTSLELEGDRNITDMQACLFQDGIMTQVFKDLDAADGGIYHFQLDNLTGKLYMIANLAGGIDLDAMLADNATENDFLQTTVSTGADAEPFHFFTGMIELQSSENYAYTADLKRGVARFDLLVTSGQQPISVKKIELTNVAQKAYLIAQQTGVATPELSEKSDVAITFDVPVSDSKQGFIYVYEQVNEDMQVNVTVDVAGKEKLLTKTLPGNIARNTVYTIKVNKDNIDVDVNVNIEDWEDGEDTEIEA